MENINDVCNYTIFKLKSDEDMNLNHLKLQKLLYYIQAWHLAFKSETLFDGKFQAWVHGPVSREIYDRFKETKGLYDEVGIDDVDVPFDSIKLEESSKKHIDNILQSYAGFMSVQLEYMTHNEDPWIHARKGFTSNQRCEVELDETLMREYYKKRL